MFFAVVPRVRNEYVSLRCLLEDIIFMFRFSIAFGMTASLLVACGTSEQLGSDAGINPPQASSMQTAAQTSSDVTCGGTNGVRVHPCPVVLEKARYVDMSSSGPGVVNEAWGGKSCKTICKFGIVKRNVYRILAGRKCGTVSDLVMYGYNDLDQIVGKAYFQVTNDDCKH
jgi:hypothetical protein